LKVLTFYCSFLDLIVGCLTFNPITIIIFEVSIEKNKYDIIIIIRNQLFYPNSFKRKFLHVLIIKWLTYH
jgi:hypothetical protein